MFDNFNKRRGTIFEAIFLDDPGLASMDIMDLLHFFDVAEDTSGNARYNPASFARNSVRGLADNEWDEEDEPPADKRTMITVAEANKLVRKPFGCNKPAKINAVLKRTIVVIAGKHAMYIRLPSKEDEAPMHRIDFDNIAKDFLVDANKEHYGLRKRGVESFPDDYDDKLAMESAFVDRAMATRGIKKPEDYIADCNEVLKAKIEESNAIFNEAPDAPQDGVHHLPASQADPAATLVPLGGDGVHQIPEAPIIATGATIRDRFMVPDQKGRRMRRKTHDSEAILASPPSAPAAASSSSASVSAPVQISEAAGYDSEEMLGLGTGLDSD
jgi:hypothetical protein